MAELAHQFTIRRKIFTLLDAQFHIYDAAGELIGYSRQKAFKLKEDIRVYSDETITSERARIAARQIIDFSAAYDVIESATETLVGSLRRRGVASMFRNSWEILDEEGQLIGTIKEDNLALALIRRNLLNFLPETFYLRDPDGATLADLRTHFNPFVHKLTVTVYPNCPVRPALVLAAGVLLVAIEGRQR